MNLNSSSRTVQQLAQLKRNGSSRHKHAAREEQPQALETTPTKSRSWLNLDRWFKQSRKAGHVETQVHANRLENRQELEQFRDGTATQAGKYAVELHRVMVDDRLEKRAQGQLRASGVRELIETTDAGEILTLYIDDKLSRLKASIQDPALLAKEEAELRFIHARALTQLRILAFGLKYDPEEDGREEQF